MIELEIRFFGAFRKYEAQCAPVHLRVEEPVTIATIKGALIEKLRSRVPGFSDSQLIEDSAFATDRRVLSSGDMVGTACVLSILPPVCGG